jgi:hypothetical protein
MVCYTFRLIPVVLTRATVPSSRDLLTLCFSGIATQLNVMFIYQMSLILPSIVAILGAIRGLRNRISGQADGLLRAGRFKSSLPWLRLNSLLENASDLVTRVL